MVDLVLAVSFVGLCVPVLGRVLLSGNSGHIHPVTLPTGPLRRSLRTVAAVALTVGLLRFVLVDPMEQLSGELIHPKTTAALCVGLSAMGAELWAAWLTDAR